MFDIRQCHTLLSCNTQKHRFTLNLYYFISCIVLWLHMICGWTEWMLLACCVSWGGLSNVDGQSGCCLLAVSAGEDCQMWMDRVDVACLLCQLGRIVKCGWTEWMLLACCVSWGGLSNVDGQSGCCLLAVQLGRIVKCGWTEWMLLACCQMWMDIYVFHLYPYFERISPHHHDITEHSTFRSQISHITEINLSVFAYSKFIEHSTNVNPEQI